jgi:hypothetical protein
VQDEPDEYFFLTVLVLQNRGDEPFSGNVT